MQRVLLKAKIQKLTVTEANIDYEGSLSLDEELMIAADMKPFEQVHVYNVSNGERFVTYLIKGAAGSGSVAVNGAAVYKAKMGDKLIVASYVNLEDQEIDFFVPKIILVDAKNHIKEAK